MFTMPNLKSFLKNTLLQGKVRGKNIVAILIFYNEAIYLLSFLCDVCNEVHEHV